MACNCKKGTRPFGPSSAQNFDKDKSPAPTQKSAETDKK